MLKQQSNLTTSINESSKQGQQCERKIIWFNLPDSKT